MSTQQQQPVVRQGIVKQVLSGDAIIIRGQPRGGPPPERQLNFSNINAPKLARKAPLGSDIADSKDEPYAWEAREFLRKKLIGKEVCFTIAPVPKLPSGREYGTVYLGKDMNGENLTESIVAEGLATVRDKPNENAQKLQELQEAAKSAGKGKWAAGSEQEHIRDVKWVIENPRNFMESLHQKPVKAIVEHVRDGSTMRMVLLPDFYNVTVMLSGIRCPTVKSEEKQTESEAYAEEAKYFTESRLLQREVEVILESVANQNFFGTVLHPNGNITELLLKEGFARCVDWSITFVTGGAQKLRDSERVAKEKCLRIWKEYKPGPTINIKDKEFQGKVIEVVFADSLVVKLADGKLKKVFLASIRPPRLDDKQANPKDDKSKGFRALYGIPCMYEAREFLRKKLIGKKVNVVVDYIQPAANNFPEKICCTVTTGGLNVAEALVSKGLATVVRYRQDDDQRSAHYDELLAAEMKALKSGKGVHSKKEASIRRVVDLFGNLSKAKQFLPFLQRAGRTDGIVEFVASGSRLRLFIPRENCLITFLLAGINCPRAGRMLNTGAPVESEPFGDDALMFTKELCLQREVEIEVESMDKAGNFIGWLWVETQNMSELLVKEGLASVHFTAERSPYARALQISEDSAKNEKLKIWAEYEEPKEQELKEETIERNVDYKSVVVTDVCPDLSFYAQHVDDGPKLEELMEELRQEFKTNPPMGSAYTPKKNDLCAALFSDGQWYRAQIEKVSGDTVHLFYVDFGNREVTNRTKLAALPMSYRSLPSCAHKYGLACIKLPSDVELVEDARNKFFTEVDNRVLLLNHEYRSTAIDYVTLLTSDEKDDVGKSLIAEGLVLVEKRKERRLQKVIADFKVAEEAARRKRLNLWCYGDFTEDDAKEFGYQP